VRQLDLHLQTAWYDVFHRSRINQVSHALCMGPIVWSLLVLASAAPWLRVDLPWFDLGLVAAGALTIAYIAMDRVLGLVMAPIVAALWWTAHLFVGARGEGALPAALAVLIIAGALQTWTHAFEDVPPPLSGTSGWVPVAAWRRTTPLSRQLLAFALTLSVYILVEIASSPRLLGVQVFKLLLRLGYQPSVRAELTHESTRILSGGAG
ncbi:MAG TPA: hypothetical protein VLS89_08400, partial [Candidatus Nanopelagicales bacterium]|nr:hypothetical protein [Candidatus Nanopelagicales bacterium]